MLIIAVLAAPAPSSLVSASAIEVSSRSVHIGDIVDLTRMDPAHRHLVAARVVVRLPAGRFALSLSRRALAVLVHRVAPHLTLADQGGSVLIRLRSPAGQTLARSDCFVTIGQMNRGDTLTAAMVAPIACAQTTARSTVAFDRQSGAPVAGSALAGGAYLGRMTPHRANVIHKGEALRLISTDGAVRVERQVTALQSGSGTRLFVRDPDGTVFAARLDSATGKTAK